MLVRDIMKSDPITISADASVPDALSIMRKYKLRRLPVIDRNSKLVGMVSDSDLISLLPSPVSTVSAWEIPEMLFRIKVDSVMSHEVFTVSEDSPLEEAARIMADHRIAGLPVMRDKMLVGIVTETNLFKTFVEQLGGRREGTRITILTPGEKGTLAKISTAIFKVGGDIVGLGIIQTKDGQWEITFKVQDAEREKLIQVINPLVSKILDVRQTIL